MWMQDLQNFARADFVVVFFYIAVGSVTCPDNNDNDNDNDNNNNNNDDDDDDNYTIYMPLNLVHKTIQSAHPYTIVHTNTCGLQ